MSESGPSRRGVQGRVLIADDQVVARVAYRALTQAGHQCEVCGTASDVVSALERRAADVVLADLAILGPELQSRLQHRYPDLALIALTSGPRTGSALAAMRQGAFDYLIKPLDEDELCAKVGRAVEMGRLRLENEGLQRRMEMAEAASSFIAESPAGKQLLALVRRAASVEMTVLIEGESGTGKEQIARMLHHFSERSAGPFIPADLKGSAEVAQAGRSRSLPFDKASGGTLFLDEVGEASAALQAEIAHFLDEAESRPARVAPNPNTEVRVIASTSRPLRSGVDAGRFRADLFFRLAAFPIVIPPLRERREDILPLARRFLADYAARTARRLSLTSDAERELLAYPWPGNVRELRNVIERAAMLTGSDFVPSKSLDLPPRPERLEQDRESALSSVVPREARPPEPPKHPDGAGARPEPAQSLPQARPPEEPAAGSPQPQAPAEGEAENGTLQECLDKAARARIKDALEAVGGNRAEAARLLDVDGPTLNRLIRRLGL